MERPRVANRRDAMAAHHLKLLGHQKIPSFCYRGVSIFSVIKRAAPCKSECRHVYDALKLREGLVLHARKDEFLLLLPALFIVALQGRKSC
ncbi:hypothetical protein CEXT_317581 [Caerostris extrusa]|uniref:Uncharacterized protein n=1 Tax=Caerostris extrusa TaxID=172846 RepID=A0AAV4QWR7_CAEEX|nr:hypothetical protein CEXT_317581 [Caerostris extrusa]